MQQTQCTAWWKGHRASARSLPAINLCNLCKNIQKYSNAGIRYFSNICAKLFHFRPWLQIFVGYLCKKCKPCKNIRMLEWLQILCLHRSTCKYVGKTDEKHNHSNNESNISYISPTNIKYARSWGFSVSGSSYSLWIRSYPFQVWVHFDLCTFVWWPCPPFANSSSLFKCKSSRGWHICLRTSEPFFSFPMDKTHVMVLIVLIV